MLPTTGIRQRRAELGRSGEAAARVMAAILNVRDRPKGTEKDKRMDIKTIAGVTEKKI